MSEQGDRNRRGEPGWTEVGVRWALPLATLLFFAVTAAGYGIFRDELYYLACGRRLAWGYVDHPPGIALVARLAELLFGGWLPGLRLLPALAAAGTVLLVGDSARALGGGRWARLLAQLFAATAPIYLSLFTILSMNALDVVIWAGLARLALALLAGADPRLWLGFGALAGAGLLTKLDVGLLGAGLGVGVLLARRFELLRERWLWAGAALAALMFTPHVLWQVEHGFPTREFVAAAQAGKIQDIGALGFAAAQLEMAGPFAALVALAGLAWLLGAGAARRFRPLGWAVVVVFAVFALGVSKAYYFAPAWSILFPAGAVVLEWATARWRPRLLRSLSTLAAVSTLAFAPLAKPLLPVDAYLRYAAALGFAPGSAETHRLGRLPQFFADMHGWQDLAATVARVAAALPAEDRARACVFGRNYGEAGAVEHFGPALGAPPAISGHNSYWLWGPGDCTGEVLIVLGGDPERLASQFASVERAAIFRCDDCMPYENNLPIHVARGLRAPLAEAWSEVRHYN